MTAQKRKKGKVKTQDALITQPDNQSKTEMAKKIVYGFIILFLLNYIGLEIKDFMTKITKYDAKYPDRIPINCRKEK